MRLTSCQLPELTDAVGFAVTLSDPLLSLEASISLQFSVHRSDLYLIWHWIAGVRRWLVCGSRVLVSLSFGIGSSSTPT
jgi:hypothetical protein